MSDRENKASEEQWEAEHQDFCETPTIRGYLALKEKYPNQEPGCITFCGLEALYAMIPELEKWSIDPVDVAAAMDADPKAIESLSLQILKAMLKRQEVEEREKQPAQGRGLVIPDRIIDYLIATMIEGMEQYGEPHCIGALNFLLKERMGGAKTAQHRATEKKKKRDMVVAMRASFTRLGWNVSDRKIAEILDVQPSTVARLFEPGEYEKLVADEVVKPPLKGILFEEDDPLFRALHRNLRAQHL